MRSLCVPVLAILASCAPPTATFPDIAYARHGVDTTYDVYVPHDGKAVHPGVFAVHGGQWSQGSKAAFGPLCRELAEQGYVCATVSYRLVPEGKWPVEPQDVLCAFRHFHQNAARFALDPARIAAMGVSAGGHLVSLLGTSWDSPELAGDCASPDAGHPAVVVSASGPQDLRELAWAFPVPDFLGGTPKEVPDVYDRASPLLHVRPDSPEFLFIHGAQDAFVPMHQSERMREALRAQGVAANLFVLSGGGHVMNPGTNGGELESGGVIDTAEGRWAFDDFLARKVGTP